MGIVTILSDWALSVTLQLLKIQGKRGNSGLKVGLFMVRESLDGGKVPL